MQKRTAAELIEDNRIKRRRLRAGPNEKIDDECEEFIAKAIEAKATYHGRRKETVMFTNRRVKSRDLLNIANHNLEKRGKNELVLQQLHGTGRDQEISVVFRVRNTKELPCFVQKNFQKRKTASMGTHTISEHMCTM